MNNENKAKVSEDIIASLKKAKNADSYLQTLFGTDKNLPEQLICFAMVKELASLGLAEKWAFARKFAEYLTSAGINLGDTRNNINRLFILSTVCNAAAIAKDEKTALYKIVKLMCEGEKAVTLTGANCYDGVVWFNKETSDWTLAHGFAVALMDEKNEDAAVKAFATLVKAKDNAEYKCEEFLKPFAPKEKTAKKTAAKATKKAKDNSEKKSEKPAKKTAAKKSKK